MGEFINSHKPDLTKVIEHFKKETAALRVGRAAPSLIENIKAESYGVLTPIIHLASITVQDPKNMVVQPWDKNNLKPIEKVLQSAELGASISVDGGVIRIAISSMTEEARKEVTKKLHQKTEEARVSIRGKREKIKEEVINQEKNKEISEDDKFKFLEELDNLVKDYNEEIKELAAKKEQEIMTI
ncbi:ribosome recycling factor [Patescibacteria group bacterium]|nr:ribosome recycling factor [Patescibacteria group bacterium]